MEGKSAAGGKGEQFARSVEGRFAGRIEVVVPARHNAKLRRVIEWVNGDDEIYALWLAANVTAIERLTMTDHGPVHVKIVANLAVKMLRLLVEAGIEPGVVTDYEMTKDDAEVVVTLAALFHDLGMAIHRADHEEFSLFIARPKLNEILDQLYSKADATILCSEILHAIIAHRAGGRPLTLEAGVLRIADALDMAEGRSRIPFKSGSPSIHSVSAAAIEGVRLEKGVEKPVRVVIEMSNSAGVFQLDELLRKKLTGSGLEPHLELEVEMVGEQEKRLLDRYEL